MWPVGTNSKHRLAGDPADHSGREDTAGDDDGQHHRGHPERLAQAGQREADGDTADQGDGCGRHGHQPHSVRFTPAVAEPRERTERRVDGQVDAVDSEQDQQRNGYIKPNNFIFISI